MRDYIMVVGKNVKICRKKAKLTQETLGKKLGLQQAAISRIEQGKQGLDPNQLYAISRFFKVQPDFFFKDIPRV